MTSGDILNEIRRIAKEVLPKGGQLILFGSWARNEASQDSDWDLLILLDKPEIDMKDSAVKPYESSSPFCLVASNRCRQH